MDGSERRKRKRLPWLNLEAKLKVKKSLFSSAWLEVRPFDYNKFGMGIMTIHDLELGDKINISLRLDLEVGEIVIEDLIGVIRYKSPKMGLNSFGLEFDSDSKIFKKQETQEHLERIEQILAKHAELVEKLQR